MLCLFLLYLEKVQTPHPWHVFEGKECPWEGNHVPGGEGAFLGEKACSWEASAFLVEEARFWRRKHVPGSENTCLGEESTCLLNEQAAHQDA